MMSNEMILKINKKIDDKFIKKEYSFDKNKINIIYAKNGMGKSTISKWIIRKSRNEKIFFKDIKKDKKIDITNKISFVDSSYNDLQCDRTYYLLKPSHSVSINKQYYFNAPSSSMFADSLFIKDIFDKPIVFKNMLDFAFLYNTKIPKNFTMPKKISKFQGKFLEQNDTYEAILDIKESLTFVKRPANLHTAKFLKNSKEKGIYGKWEYARNDTGFKILWKKNVNTAERNVWKNIFKKMAMILMLNESSDIFLNILKIKKYEDIADFNFVSEKFVDQVINMVKTQIFMDISYNSKIKGKLKIWNGSNDWNNDEIKAIFNDYKVPVRWGKDSKGVNSFMAYTFKKYNIKKESRILLRIQALYKHYDEIVKYYKQNTLKLKCDHIYNSFSKTNKGIDFSINATQYDVNILFDDEKYNILSSAQKSVLNIKASSEAISNYFLQGNKEKEKILVIDDFTEVMDKVKIHMFLRSLSNIAITKNTTIIFYTHDYSVLRIANSIIRRASLFTLTNNGQKKHEIFYDNRELELLSILKGMDNNKLENGEFLFLIRYFLFSSSSPAKYTWYNGKRIHIQVLRDEFNNYFHYARTNTQAIHDAFKIFLKNNIKNSIENSNIQISNHKFLNSDDFLSKVEDVKHFEKKIETSDINGSVSKFCNAINRRMKIEKYTGRDKNADLFDSIIQKLLVKGMSRSEIMSRIEIWDIILSELNQTIHIESNDTLIFTDDLDSVDNMVFNKLTRELY